MDRVIDVSVTLLGFCATMSDEAMCVAPIGAGGREGRVTALH